MKSEHNQLIEELVKLLEGGSAHATFRDAVKGLPGDQRGIRTGKLPYSIWQIVEHIRIAQWDMVEFSLDGKQHESPEWPDGYWPKEVGPKNDAAWRKSLRQIEDDRERFVKLLSTADIYAKIPGGNGQTILKEAMQIADHNAYHTAEIIVIRRLLGSWKS